MSDFRTQTTAEQVAAHLRAGIAGDRLRGVMSGVLRLESELGVNRKTVETALRQLEIEGLLLAQGAGNTGGRLVRAATWIALGGSRSRQATGICGGYPDAHRPWTPPDRIVGAPAAAAASAGSQRAGLSG